MVFASLLLVAGGCSFPAERTQCWSPDKRMVIEWVMKDDAVTRQLLWRDARTGRHGVLRDFNRTVGVFWSPANHHLAITDAAGSDNSHALRWEGVDGPARSFEHDLHRSVPDTDPIWRNHHQYFDIVRWVNSREILVRAWGYGNPQDPLIDRLYVWDAQGKVRRVSRRTSPLIPEKKKAIRPDGGVVGWYVDSVRSWIRSDRKGTADEATS